MMRSVCAKHHRFGLDNLSRSREEAFVTHIRLCYRGVRKYGVGEYLKR